MHQIASLLNQPHGPLKPSQNRQQPQDYTVTTTAQLLTELLPLLASYCLAKVQQQCLHRQQLMEALALQLQQADTKGQAAGVKTPSCHAHADLGFPSIGQLLQSCAFPDSA